MIVFKYIICKVFTLKCQLDLGCVFTLSQNVSNNVQRDQWTRNWRKHFLLYLSTAVTLWTLYERYSVYHFILTSALWNTHKSSDETGGDVFIQVVASASLISIFPPPPQQHKNFNQSPTLFAVMWKPTIWQPSQSKPKQDSSDSWRLLCKIKQEKKYFIFLKIFSSPTASTLSYLKSIYSKITMKTAKTWDQWRVNTPQKKTDWKTGN